MMKVSFTTLLAAGAVLMFSLLAAAPGQDVPRESQVKNPAGFNGRWTNVDAAQAAIQDAVTRLEIHSNAEKIFVRMWGQCKPLDCDWGEESAPIADREKGAFTLAWRRGAMGVTQKVSLLDNGLLRIEGHTRWAAYAGRDAESYSVLLARSPDFKPSAAMSAAPVAVQRAGESVAALLAEDSSGRPTVVGNGFFMQRDLLATSYTLIKGRPKLFARLAISNTTFPVTEIVRYDEEADLAFIRVPGANAWPLSAPRNMLVGGIDVFVISNSKGTEPAVSRGVISTTRQSGNENQIEITAPASAADIGSPVLNKRAEVIGLLTSVEEETRVILATRASLFALLIGRAEPSRSDVTRPVSLTFPRPQYTEKARNNKVSGTVAMRVLVGADGTVKQVEVIRGLPDGLTEEAVKSMRQTKFRPATKNGQPIDYWLTTEASFNVR